MIKAKWVSQHEVDRAKWDQLVATSFAECPYIYAYYLDAVSIDWEAYVAEDYAYAIPVGVVHKGGLKRAYPPLFQGFVQAIGDTDQIDWNHFEKTLLARFAKGEINLKGGRLESVETEEYVYQTLQQADFKLKTQAKRMLKRYENTEYQISETVSTDDLAQLIVKELAQKLPIYASKDVQFFYDLIAAAEKQQVLYKLGLFEKGVLLGGLIGIQSQSEMLYFKGAATEQVLQAGGMYALMNQLIEKAFAENLQVNFGGSRVEGVRFFYQRFNGKDETYQHYTWDHAPFWFKWGYGLYKKWKK